MTWSGSNSLTARHAAAVVVALVLAIACAPGPRVAPAGPADAETSATPSPSPTPDAPVAVTTEYGKVTVRTLPLAACAVQVRVSPGAVGSRPPTSLSGTSDDSGLLTLTYDAPRIPAAAGSYEIACTAGSLTSAGSLPFAVSERSLKAGGLRVKLKPDDGMLDRSPIQVVPSLVPARDAMLAKLKATLVTEWRLATRGLGAISVVDVSEDILITVVAQRGTSVHRRSGDGSEDIVVYAADGNGPISSDNGVAVAMHELGHIWCCYGEGTTDGHWSVVQKSPELSGIDAYGLMNHPVQCVVFSTTRIESCPNRFSERELRAMGFTVIPPPPPDPCLTQKGTLAATLRGQDTQLASLKARITAIETQYPNGAPPDVYQTYQGLIAQYNQLIEARNVVVSQLNALLC